MHAVQFRSDEGPEDARLEISYAGNLDWYLWMLPADEDAGAQMPVGFRIATSGSQLPEAVLWAVSALHAVGQGDLQLAIQRSELLTKVLRDELSLSTVNPKEER